MKRDPFQQRDEDLKDILRRWGDWIHGSDDDYYDHWPEYLQESLKLRGYWVAFLPSWEGDR